nr:MAG TPA: hypothetical protein [Caudoviricetes sp.]
MDSLYIKFITLMALYSLLNVLRNSFILILVINNNMASMTWFHGQLRRAVKSCYLLPKISLQPLMRS